MKLIITLMLALSLTAAAAAQDAGPSADTSVPDSLWSTYPGASGVFTHLERHVRQRRRADTDGVSRWRLEEHVDRAYVVLDPRDEALGRFELTLTEADDLETVELTIVAPDSTVTSFDKEDLVPRWTSTGALRYAIDYPDVQVGSRIHETYRVLHHGYRGKQIHNVFVAQARHPVQRFTIRYVYPREWTTKVKAIAPGVQPQGRVESEDGQNVIVYEAHDVPAYRDELFAPYYREYAPYLELMHPRHTNLVRGEPETWAEVAKQKRKYAMGRGSAWSRISKRLERATRDVVGDEADLRARMDSVLAYIDAEIALRDGPDVDDIDDVLANGHGNAQLITGLAQRMLSVAGVPSTYLFVHPHSLGHFDPRFVTAEQLPVPALRIELEADTLYAFPYLKHLAAGQLPEVYQGAIALEVDRDDPQLIQLPPVESAGVDIEEDYAVRVDEDGRLQVVETRTYSGLAAYRLRRAIDEATEGEIEEAMRELLTYTDGAVEMTDYAIKGRDAYGTPLGLRFEYVVDNLVARVPGEAVFQTAGLFAPLSRIRTKVDPEDRTAPIRIYHSEAAEKRIEITVPEGWSLQTLPEDVDVENGYGRIQSFYTRTDDGMRVEQRVQLKRSEGPATDAAALYFILGTASRLQVPTLVFDVDDASATAEPGVDAAEPVRAPAANGR